jgi:uncharacterized protein (DUF433 family)
LRELNNLSLREELVVPATRELFTASEAAAVTGVPLRAVYKAMKERLPRRLLVGRGRGARLTYPGALCVRLDRELPKDVPVKVRLTLYAELTLDCERVEHAVGPLRYVIDVGRTRAEVDRELTAYRRALRLVVEDPEVQGGAATFEGTRILVHQVAALLDQGATVEELKTDYPNLTDAMIEAAPMYARAHPRRGRPRSPNWRGPNKGAQVEGKPRS